MTSAGRSASILKNENWDEPTIVRRTQAKRDIAQIACFIADENIAAAGRFLEAVEASLIALARMPHIGASRYFRNPKFADVRMWQVRGL